MLQRLRALFAAVPGPRVWTGLLGLTLGLLAASWLLDRLGLAAWHVDTAFLLGFGAFAGLGTAVVEESLFRGILLKPPPAGASGFGASALSALLFALWHPFQTLLYHPLWEAHAWAWWFLLGTALLGFACARLTLATRSDLARDRLALVDRDGLEDALRHPLLRPRRWCIILAIHWS